MGSCRGITFYTHIFKKGLNLSTDWRQCYGDEGVRVRSMTAVDLGQPIVSVPLTTPPQSTDCCTGQDDLKPCPPPPKGHRLLTLTPNSVVWAKYRASYNVCTASILMQNCISFLSNFLSTTLCDILKVHHVIWL